MHASLHYSSRHLRAREVGLHRVVDHQVGRADGVDFVRIAAERFHRLPHGGEIHHGRYAGKVLQAAGGSRGSGKASCQTSREGEWKGLYSDEVVMSVASVQEVEL